MVYVFFMFISLKLCHEGLARFHMYYCFPVFIYERVHCLLNAVVGKRVLFVLLDQYPLINAEHDSAVNVHYGIIFNFSGSLNVKTGTKARAGTQYLFLFRRHCVYSF